MKNIIRNVFLSLFIGVFAFSSLLVSIPSSVAFANEGEDNQGQEIDNGNQDVSGNQNQGNDNPGDQDNGDNQLSLKVLKPKPTTGSLTVCKSVLNADGESITDIGDSTFTISFTETGDEGDYSGTVPPDFVFDEDLNYEDTTEGYQTECKTVSELPLGRYYYEEESISDSENWEEPLYQDQATKTPGAPVPFSADNTNDFSDGAINLSENNQDRVLLVVNKMKSVPTANLHATKIVCDSEVDLPNWGAGSADITSTTASTFLSEHDNCHLEDWNFEWIENANEPAPKDDGVSHLADWSIFDTQTTIPAGVKIWVREQANDDYIPFTGANTDQDVSAEMYCNNDVLNYDNLEWINTEAGENYYCVAWNVLKEPAEPKVCNIVSDTTNIVEGGSNAVETWNHSGWYDETLLSGVAKWIWETLNVENPTLDETKVFVKTFNLDSAPSSANIDVAADNGFILEINGVEVANEITNEFNYGAKKSYNALSNLVVGPNTIRMTVKNFALAGSTSETNPAGALYSLHIEDSSCSSVPTEPETSTVTMCKVDSQENPLPGWQLMILGEKFGSTEVLSNGQKSTISAIPPSDYVLKASGQYTYRGTAGAEFSDAAYSKRAPSDPVYVTASSDPMQSPYLPWVRENNFPSPNTGWLGISMSFNNLDPVFTDWGSMFNPLHIYALGLNTEGEDLSFKIFDDQYSDNSGSLNVDMYEGYTGITGENGCVVFNDVPYGNYTLDEIMQDGWENVSGLVEVSVNEPTETFTVVNREITTIIDTDKDGIPDTQDNCPITPNPDQADADGDGVGDVCDNCPSVANVNQADSDDNGVGDVCQVPDDEETTIYDTKVIKSANMAQNIGDVISDISKWFFYNDETDVIDNSLGSFVDGPDTAPIGDGSSEISVNGTQRRNLATYKFKDVKLADITSLSFSTYSQLLGDGANGLSERAPYLNFNVDFNNSDTWQKRLIFVPGQNGVVTSDTWQTWDAINSGNALWAYSGATWPTTGQPGSTLKTWSQILADYPNAETRSTDSWFGFRVGEPYADGFTGNVDKFVIGIKNGLVTTVTTYDFEPTEQTPVIYACSNDVDDDGDGNTDYPSDPGCSSAIDNDEVNETEVCELPEVMGENGCYTPEQAPKRSSRSSGSYIAPSLVGQVLGAEASCGIYVDKFLKKGLKGNDNEAVKKVQEFLNNYMGTKLKVDGNFGSQTDMALKAFQNKHKDTILDPWGLKSPTGIFYLTTQTKVNNIMCPELDLQIPTLVPMAQNPLFPKA